MFCNSVIASSKHLQPWGSSLFLPPPVTYHAPLRPRSASSLLSSLCRRSASKDWRSVMEGMADEHDPQEDALLSRDEALKQVSVLAVWPCSVSAVRRVQH